MTVLIKRMSSLAPGEKKANASHHRRTKHVAFSCLCILQVSFSFTLLVEFILHNSIVMWQYWPYLASQHFFPHKWTHQYPIARFPFFLFLCVHSPWCFTSIICLVSICLSLLDLDRRLGLELPSILINSGSGLPSVCLSHLDPLWYSPFQSWILH